MPSLNSVLVTALAIPFAQLAHGQLFTVNCQPLVVERSDPIVSPGAVSGHVHAVIGGTAFQRTMSQTTAVNAKNTTCDKQLDKSNYWQPQLYHQRTDGQFDLVTFQGSAVYYLNRACDYAPGRTTCPDGYLARAPPAGLRMVVGNPTLRTFDPNNFAQQAIQHVCLRQNDGAQYNSLPTSACLRMRAETYFPSCWDGINLDSSDHSSHMAFPVQQYNGGVCPQSHPKAIYSVFYEFFYDTSPFPDFNKWVYAMGDPTGYGLHADFINGWNQDALNNAAVSCTGPQGAYSPDCSVNKGEGSAQSFKPEIASSPVENVGLTGPIPALPGNNPITGTPIKARSRLFGGLI